MAWVVDTCRLIDVAEGDPAFGVSSAALLDARRPGGLTNCPVTYAELGPVVDGDATAQNEFLANLAVKAIGSDLYLLQFCCAGEAFGTAVEG